MNTPIVLSGSYADQMDAVFTAARDVLYKCAGKIVRVKDDEIDEVDATRLQSHLIDHLTPIKIKLTKSGDEIETPDKKFERDLCQHMIDRTVIDLPLLEYVYRCPVFAGDWQPMGEYGYHEDARAWLNTKGLDDVEPMDMARAKSIIDDLLCDFPFADVASKTHAVMAMVTPFIRPMVGLMPLFLITAPTEGSGKTLLADIVGLISDGRSVIKITSPSDDDEWRKRITSTLKQTPSVVLIDNINNLDSPSLAAALTAKMWTDRVLGSTINISVPNNAVWFGSGNNPTVSAEMARRCIPIRLVPDTERPGERKFRHEDIERYVLDNRAQLVSACMTLVYEWAQGRADVDVSMGSYQQWATAASSIAAHAGYLGALTNREMLRTDDSSELHALVSSWADHPILRNKATAGDLEKMCGEDDIMLGVRGGSLHASQRAKKLSAYLGGHVDRVCGLWRIKSDTDSHTKQRVFSLEKIA